MTGDSTPYEFPVKPVRLVQEWPEEPPFKPEDFFRADSNDDGNGIIDIYDANYGGTFHPRHCLQGSGKFRHYWHHRCL